MLFHAEHFAFFLGRILYFCTHKSSLSFQLVKVPIPLEVNLLAIA